MTKASGALTAGLCIPTFSLGAYATDDEYKAAKKPADATYRKTKADCQQAGDQESRKSCMLKAKTDRDAAKDKLKAVKK